MNDPSILFVCSRCDARFQVYDDCVQHTTSKTKCGARPADAKFAYQSIEDFSKTLTPVSKAFRNFKYHEYIHQKLLSFLPGDDVDEAARRPETKGAWRLLNQTKPPSRRVEFHDATSGKTTIRQVPEPGPLTLACLELGPLTLKNVGALLRNKANKEFAKNSTTLLYNGHAETFPKHITHLWSKTDLHFWPFFFSKEHIFSNIFSPNCVRMRETECLIFGDDRREWTVVDADSAVLKPIADRVIVPLMQSLCCFVVDCVKNKKCNLNSKWKDVDDESRSISIQLMNIFGGEWFDFFQTLPNAFQHFSPSLPPVQTFLDCGLDSVLKSEIPSFSRAWIPFLAIFCPRDDIVSKYGTQFLQPDL
jgi:hypothetical protein